MKGAIVVEGPLMKRLETIFASEVLHQLYSMNYSLEGSAYRMHRPSLQGCSLLLHPNCR